MSIQVHPYGIAWCVFTPIQVTNNGHISPGAPNIDYTPKELPRLSPMIAVYWADADTRPRYGGVVWFRNFSTPDLLRRALTDIQCAYPLVSVIDYIVIVTWDHVGYYSMHTEKVKKITSLLYGSLYIFT